MRIIAGKVRGHKLQTPKDLQIRPTIDRVKESIFNIIQNYIYDGIIIDLFSGTGNLGIEALSRNAKKAYFIDNSHESIDIIKTNLNKTGLKNEGEIIKADAIEGINKLSLKGIQADIIFMDPPYKKGLIIPVLENIAYKDVLKNSGIVVVEHDNQEDLPEEVDKLIKYKAKKYGNTTVSFLKQKEEI